MKEGWSEVALGDVLEDAVRFECPQPGVKYRQLGVRLWGEGAYEREPIDGGDTQYAAFNRCENGDMVVNKIWARNGSVSVVQPELSGCFVSAEFPLYQAKSPIIPGWLRLITKARWLWIACDEKARGTSGKNRIKPSAFLEIRIPLPPLTEQQRLVVHFDAIETRLHRVKKLRTEQEHELQATLRSAFHELEAQAEWVAMSEVAPVHRRPTGIELDGEYPELGVRSFGKGIFHKPTLLGESLTWQKLFQINAGDIVISNIKAWEGAIAVAGGSDHGRYGSHRYLTCLTDLERALPEFICFYLLSKSGLEQVGVASPGSADRNRTLAVDRLEKIKVPLIPIAHQIEFKKLLDLQAKLRAEAAQAEQRTAALLPSLLDRIFNS